MGQILDRYLNGDISVWHDIEFIERDSPDAIGVVEEAMNRISRNTVLLSEKLKSIGYQFGRYSDGSEVPGYRGPLSRPTGKTIEQVDQLIAEIGDIPLTLKIFWLRVGEVDFTGHHPDWHSDVLSDAYVVCGVSATFYELKHCWDPDGGEPFSAIISPDSYHKENVSGGASYGIDLPQSTINPLVVNTPEAISFIDYFRLAFEWNGFPGYKGTNAYPNMLEAMKLQLLPL